MTLKQQETLLTHQTEQSSRWFQLSSRVESVQHRDRRRIAGAKLLPLAAAAIAAIMVMLPLPARADMNCGAYYHTHNHSYHVYYTHYVYSSFPSGTGEQTSWKEDYYNFGIVYQGVYYGSKYCP